MVVSAIYVTTGTEDWPDAAKKLQIHQDIQPKYWVTHKLADKVERLFDNVTIHDSKNAINAEFPEDPPSGILYSPLDSKILSKFSYCETIALEMMNRHDGQNRNNQTLTYQQRIDRYHEYLSYWSYIVEKNDLDVAIFGSTPHLVYDYILYCVCRHFDVETVILTHTGLPNRFLVRNQIHEDPLNQVSTSTDKSISEINKKYLQNIKQDYDSAEPSYMSKDRIDRGIIDYVDRIIKSGQIAYRSVTNLLYLLEKKLNYKKSLDERLYSQIRNGIASLFIPKLYRLKLKRDYENKSSCPDTNKQYIYFPLHYQPERTTSPEGGYYTHQHLAINLIVSEIPDNWEVFVKEHPSQFSSRLQGEKGRSPDYYEYLQQIPSVSLVTMNSNPFDLIDNAEAVATVTGTSGWEALIRGTPTIVFGNAWYRTAPGCYYVKSTDDLTSAINSISEDDLTANNIEHFISSVEKNSYIGSLNSKNDKNIESLYSAVCDSINECRVERKTAETSDF